MSWSHFIGLLFVHNVCEIAWENAFRVCMSMLEVWTRLSYSFGESINILLHLRDSHPKEIEIYSLWEELTWVWLTFYVESIKIMTELIFCILHMLVRSQYICSLYYTFLYVNLIHHTFSSLFSTPSKYENFFKKLKHYLNSYNSNIFSITNWRTQFQTVTLNSVTLLNTLIFHEWQMHLPPHLWMIVVNICKGNYVFSV